MNLIIIIILVILVLILDFFEKKYVKLFMVLRTMLIMGIILLLNGTILVFIYGLSNDLPLLLKLFLINISLLPIVFISEYIAHTIRIFDFYINRKKVLEKGIIQKGIISEIKSYSFYPRRISGYYLIVNFDGKKIKSLPFSKYHLDKMVYKNNYEECSHNIKLYKIKNNEVFTISSASYNVGNEIEVIIYKNKKYVITD